MCDANASEKLLAVSSAVSALGNLLEGKQTQRYYNYQGEQAERFDNYKADQADADAAYERGMGQVRASRIRKAGVFQQAEVKAGYAGSGIDVTQGTPLTTAEILQRNISEDATMQLLTGERRARQLEAEAQGYRYAGSVARASGIAAGSVARAPGIAAGANARTSSYLAAGRSLLTGTAAIMNARIQRDKWIRKAEADRIATERVRQTGAFDPMQEHTP